MGQEFEYDVFLSHSAKDKAVVRPLAERLRQDGLKVWFDKWVLKPGDSIPAKIDPPSLRGYGGTGEGLEGSKCRMRNAEYRIVKPGMSASAFGSGWAQLETGTYKYYSRLKAASVSSGRLVAMRELMRGARLATVHGGPRSKLRVCLALLAAIVMTWSPFASRADATHRAVLPAAGEQLILTSRDGRVESWVRKTILGQDTLQMVRDGVVQTETPLAPYGHSEIIPYFTTDSQLMGMLVNNYNALSATAPFDSFMIFYGWNGDKVVFDRVGAPIDEIDRDPQGRPILIDNLWFWDGTVRIAYRPLEKDGATGALEWGDQETEELHFKHPSEAVSSVTVTNVNGYYEIGNSNVAVRIPSQQLLDTANRVFIPAPIQGVRYTDGAWSGSRPTYLTVPVPPTNSQVELLEQTPERVSVKVSYRFSGPAFDAYNAQMPPTRQPGPGFYTFTVSLGKGDKSFVVEEDANLEVSYSFSVYDGLAPDTARYRGHNSTSPENGHEPDGRQYRLSDQRPAMDAEVDLRYAFPKSVWPMATWNPWIADRGWYWQLFNDQPSAPSDNLVGVFGGNASRLLGAHDNDSGVCLYWTPALFPDIQSVRDSAGNLHNVWYDGDETWYLEADLSGTVTDIERLGAGFLHGRLEVDAGPVRIAAFDPAGGPNRDGGFVVWDKNPQGGFLQRSVAFDAPVTILDPYPLEARSPTGDELLVFYGQRGSRTGLLLYSRAAGSDTYVFNDSVDATSFLQSDRPAFAILDDGRVMLLYSNSGTWLEYAMLDFTGATIRLVTLPNNADLQYRFSIQNFGCAIDKSNGAMMSAGVDGSLSLIVPDGATLAAQRYKTSLNLGVDLGTTGPANTRTLVSDGQGNYVATHNGQFYLFRDSTHAWEPLVVANDLALSAIAVVSYDAASGTFVLSGGYQGALTTFAYRLQDDSMAVLNELAQTRRPDAGFRVVLTRRTMDAQFFPEVRYDWGLFSGTRSHELYNPTNIQPIAVEMDRLGGLGDGRLENIHATDDVTASIRPIMSVDALKTMIQRIRTDTSYYNYLYGAEPGSRDLFDAWRDASGRLLSVAITNTLKVADKIKAALTSGDGIYDFYYQYWMGGLQMKQAADRIVLLLNDDDVSMADKRRLADAALLFGKVLWDDDFVPMFPGSGVSLGSANMPVEYASYRDYMALILSHDPEFAGRASAVATNTLNNLHAVINDFGAEIGSTHYMDPSVEPPLINALMLKRMGIVDLFATDDRLRKFSEFLLNVASPPDVRFGGLRKRIANGDGSTESTELYGLLATGFQDVDPVLSARLMAMWNAQGKRHTSFYGSTVFMINESAPSQDAPLGDADFPGYFTALRNGYGGTNETAIWHLDGTFYFDHSHNERGSVILYADGSPLSLHWGSLYLPYYDNPIMHNMLVPLSHVPWSGTNYPLTAEQFHFTAQESEYASFAQSGASRAAYSTPDYGNWTRSVYSIHPNEGLPVIFIQDDLDNDTPMVFNLNVMAQGAVQTPSGDVSPAHTIYRDGDPTTLPALGDAMPLTAGLSRFGFTGQWGVDTEIYSYSPQDQEARIGHWAHNWDPSLEQSEFQRATGKPFEVSQYVLHVKGAGKFRTILLPYRHNQKPADRTFTYENGAFDLRSGPEQTLIDPDGKYYAYVNTDTGATNLTTFAADTAESNGFSITGGPAEILAGPTILNLTVHGVAGLRTIKLPQVWQPDPDSSGAVTRDPDTGDWKISYEGGAPARLRFTR